ncbi:hypothetical protein EMPG_16961 [Blastomyces silverae]|uniref:Uncharacterized protein n=1 Tax=Blastomyces silverae TaxID=2060906 RepID=A0A0H1B958_9EURO|nr:hypothetical protein EMPG_16961 [Blastomyces silverae]
MVFLFFICVSSVLFTSALDQRGGGEGDRRKGDGGDEERKNVDVAFPFIKPEWLDNRFLGPIPQHKQPLGREREREPSGEIDSELDFEQEMSMIAESKQGLWAGVSMPNGPPPVIVTPGWTNGAPVLVDAQGSWNGSGDFFDDDSYTDTYSPLESSGDLLSPSKSPSHASDADAGVIGQQHICSECLDVFERRCGLK